MDRSLVRDYMTTDVVALRPDDGFASRSSTRAAQAKAAGDMPIARAARVMAVHGFKRLPVVGDDGALVGIISRADVMGSCW